MPNPPFSGGNDLLVSYGLADGGAAGDFRTTIPTNFTRIKNEILELHGRVQAIGNMAGAGAAAGTRAYDGPVGVNEHLQVRRWGPTLFAAFPPGSPTPNQAFHNGSAFVGPSYVGGRLGPGAGSQFAYVHSVCPGWYLAQGMFTDLGQPITAAEQDGILLTFTDPATYASSLQPGVSAGYVVAGSGDLPGVYQVLTRHVPIERLRGRRLSVKMTFRHPTSAPSGAVFQLYISYVDGASRRRDSAGSTIVLPAATDTEVMHATDLDAAIFPDGVIPLDATAVEVGLAMTSYGGPGTVVSDPWEIKRLLVDVGVTSRAGATRPLWTVDLAAAAAYYAQPLGTDVTGTDHSGLGTQHPILAAGATKPTAAQAPSFIGHYLWALAYPWRTVAAALVPACRVLEVIGAVADSAGFPSALPVSTADHTVVAAVANGASVLGGPWAERGITVHLERRIEVTVITDLSEMLDLIEIPPFRWRGEIHGVLSPIGY